ncbi:MAG: transglutaminase-like domain-containing protein, partial [Actinomycetota bacterium]
MIRLRLAVLGVISLALAAWAGDVFDQRVWTLLLAAVIPTAAAALTADRRWFVRLPTAVLAVVATVAAAVALEDGAVEDTWVPVTTGLRRLLSTEWPSPVRADLVATIVAALAILTTIGAELARWRRLHLVPLLPMILAGAMVIALSSPRGVAVGWPIVVALAGTVFAALGTTGPIGDRLRLLRGERKLIAVLLVVATVTAAAAIPITLSGRADPRDTEDPERTASLLDPIEATLALQRIAPAVDLHRIELDGPVPTRWRTSALSDYDGRRWTPDLTLRPIGRRLLVDAEVDGPTVDATVTFLDDDLQLVPLPGRPVVVDAEIETDVARTLVRLVERPSDGTTVGLSSLVEPSLLDAPTGEIAAREVDESVSGLADVAETLSSDAGGESVTVEERLRAIETTMAEEFVLDPDAPGGGLQRALIERFLRETQRGNAEQFSTAFVLLARASGVDARVATGFVIDPNRIDGTTVTISSTDAAIWPEIRVGDAWVAFDPVPETPLAEQTSPPAEPTVQSPAAPQPPIAPPPDDIDEPLEQEEDDGDQVSDGVSTVVSVAIRVAAVAGLVLLDRLGGRVRVVVEDLRLVAPVLGDVNRVVARVGVGEGRALEVGAVFGEAPLGVVGVARPVAVAELRAHRLDAP